MVEFFYYIAPTIWSIESPIIKDTKVVTDFDNELKYVTLGNKHIPKKVYDRNTGKNYTKKKITFTKLSFINSYISTNFFWFLKNLNIVNQDVKQLMPIKIYFYIPMNKKNEPIIVKMLDRIEKNMSNSMILKYWLSVIF